MIIDSMELNGGSSMFLEMLAGFRKYYPEILVTPLVVSKSGKYGRKKLVNPILPESYGSSYDEIKSMDYECFDKNQKKLIDSETVVLHHRLQCTRPLSTSCPYVVINHTVQSPHRMTKFAKANKIISVCNYIRKLTTSYIDSSVILNGIENESFDGIKAENLSGKFRTGRCHRLNKMPAKSVGLASRLPIKGHMHYIIGPCHEISMLSKMKSYSNVKYMGAIFDKKKKIAAIKGFDVYFYDTSISEGASMAVLEALGCGVPVVCRPLGGNCELIKQDVNGSFFTKESELFSFFNRFSQDKEAYNSLRLRTLDDFKSRLHIKHMLSQYVNVLGSAM